MQRRHMLMLSTGSILSLLFGRAQSAHAAGDASFEIVRTEAEWRAVLTGEQFAILRKHQTEKPFTSALNGEKRKGVFHCAGCAQPVYSSQAKYDSGTGWPSFWEALPDAIGTREDRSLVMVRTECHCRRCGGHFGHIFDDGPPPTGKRHCINGFALTFAAG